MLIPLLLWVSFCCCCFNPPHFREEGEIKINSTMSAGQPEHRYCKYNEFCYPSNLKNLELVPTTLLQLKIILFGKFSLKNVFRALPINHSKSLFSEGGFDLFFFFLIIEQANYQVLTKWQAVYQVQGARQTWFLPSETFKIKSEMNVQAWKNTFTDKNKM